MSTADNRRRDQTDVNQHPHVISIFCIFYLFCAMLSYMPPAPTTKSGPLRPLVRNPQNPTIAPLTPPKFAQAQGRQANNHQAVLLLPQQQVFRQAEDPASQHTISGNRYGLINSQITDVMQALPPKSALRLSTASRTLLKGAAMCTIALVASTCWTDVTG